MVDHPWYKSYDPGVPHTLIRIVDEENAQITPEELQNYCGERLAAYKVPRSFEFRTELPKTMVGKMLRRPLQEEEKAKQKEAN